VSPRKLVWSYGGGTQSVAIAVLVSQGKLPRPDAVVIADTGREASETWDYLERTVQPLLGRTKVEVAPHSMSTVDLYAHNGDLLLPVFTTTGKMPTLCSNEWKRRVVRRWLRKQGCDSVKLWLGISMDEVERAKPSDVKWIEHHYPLLFDVPLRRYECRQIVLDAGLPEPPRSACWMCPLRSNVEWRDLRERAPKDWDRAVALDESIRAKDDNVFLHRSSGPLATANLESTEKLDLFCESGYCMT
jgi:hypothetical protein